MGQSKIKYGINGTGNVRLNVTLRRVRVTIVTVQKHYVF
jgi:hypothetical protein